MFHFKWNNSILNIYLSFCQWDGLDTIGYFCLEINAKYLPKLWVPESHNIFQSSLWILCFKTVISKIHLPLFKGTVSPIFTPYTQYSLYPHPTYQNMFPSHLFIDLGPISWSHLFLFWHYCELASRTINDPELIIEFKCSLFVLTCIHYLCILYCSR